MDSSFDTTRWLGEPVMDGPSGPGMPEWHALRSRLVAGRAAFRAIENNTNESPDGIVGSFDQASARALSQIGHGSDHVNQSRIDDGKPDGDIPVHVAGASMTGDRG